MQRVERWGELVGGSQLDKLRFLILRITYAWLLAKVARTLHEILAHNFDDACSRMQAQLLCIKLHVHLGWGTLIGCGVSSN